MYRAKDFIETKDGLLFAVVADGCETNKIRCFLRYIYQHHKWLKLQSDAANDYLARHHPALLYHSKEFDARLHAVHLDAVVRHYRPQAVLMQLLREPTSDPVLLDLQYLCALLQTEGIALTQIGVTGSILLGVHNPHSDIDLVCYDRAIFHQLRDCVRILLDNNLCSRLSQQDWLDTYHRRSCDLTLAEYISHEQAKFNKAIVRQRKFDLSLVSASRIIPGKIFKKLGAICLEATVIDDQYAFDYPAELMLDHAEINSVVSYTATYNGQAQTGMRVLIAGQLEVDQQGVKRVVVGSSREAPGEYIKQLR